MQSTSRQEHSGCDSLPLAARGLAVADKQTADATLGFLPAASLSALALSGVFTALQRVDAEEPTPFDSSGIPLRATTPPRAVFLAAAERNSRSNPDPSSWRGPHSRAERTNGVWLPPTAHWAQVRAYLRFLGRGLRPLLPPRRSIRFPSLSSTSWSTELSNASNGSMPRPKTPHLSPKRLHSNLDVAVAFESPALQSDLQTDAQLESIERGEKPWPIAIEAYALIPSLPRIPSIIISLIHSHSR
ncbi:hypothetical protein CYLTODRAFT_460482 [Cylindrobasidium torrendii FP15055 ss-10]|uniref:Uncharacterized protein n=1 Tax=Cylindrobasidium torrendii FP15055 ss-10 TaxID=1314674 RepID=A0A0D7ASC8_9AGAR|nr:hypothetical protein CYLTODRAFT_460482 [Cylindrobasidium torrendii FP15055 ss-10]